MSRGDGWPSISWRLTRIAVGIAFATVFALAVGGVGRAVEDDGPGLLRPNEERPLTHTELLAIRGERRANTTWEPAILVADTDLVRHGRMRGGDAWAAERPAFGALPRDGAYPGDPVILATRRVASRYPSDDSAIRGLLAISDSHTAGLRLEGTVDMPAGTYATPIAPATMATAAALPVGALIVVRGWFSRLPSADPCPSVPDALDPHDAGGRSSPFVRCPGGWITADEVTAVDPDDPTIPAAFGIPVQSEPPHRPGRPSSDVDTAGRATYLLRHVRNPVDGAEMATGWKVLGRLSAAAIPTLERPVDPRSIARPAGLDWQPGTGRLPPADVRHAISTAWRGGFATVRLGRDRVMSSWVSADGLSWESAELPPAITTVSALLRLGSGLVLIANELRFDEPWRFEVWASDDGLKWRRISRQRVSTPDRFKDRRRNVQGFWSLGSRVVALATHTTTRCCGSSPHRAFLASRDDEPDVTFAWVSRDGERWTRSRTRGIPSDTDDWFARLISRGDGELFGLWGGARDSLGRSTDGIRWRTVGRLPAGLDLDSTTVLARAEDGLVLGGTVETDSAENHSYSFTLWRSTDGETWVRTGTRPDGRPASVAASGNTVVVAGNDLDPRFPDADEPPDIPWLMVSEDGGRTWDAGLGWEGETDWCLGSLIAAGETISLEAACAPPDAASTYLLAGAEGRPSG